MRPGRTAQLVFCTLTALAGACGIGIPPSEAAAADGAVYAQVLGPYVREFWAEECPGDSSALDPASAGRTEAGCKLEAIVLPGARIGADCPVNYYASEAYRVGDSRRYVALSTMWLTNARSSAEIEPGPAAALRAADEMSGPFTVAFLFEQKGAHRVCRPERLGAVARIVWDGEAETLGQPLQPLYRSEGPSFDTDESRASASAGVARTSARVLPRSRIAARRSPVKYRTPSGPRWIRSISCFWLGCNDRRSLHVEVRSRPSGLPILLDGVRAYLTDESFWVAARRLQDIRVRMPTGVLKKLSECQRARGGNTAQLFYC